MLLLLMEGASQTPLQFLDLRNSTQGAKTPNQAWTPYPFHGDLARGALRWSHRAELSLNNHGSTATWTKQKDVQRKVIQDNACCGGGADNPSKTHGHRRGSDSEGSCGTQTSLQS